MTISLLLLITAIVFGQEPGKGSDTIYGLDPVLHNGKLYTYYPPPGTGGHQYFVSSTYPTGTIRVRGNTYTNQRLNYDVYNQQLILFYRNYDGSGKTIMVSDAWLEGFSFGSTSFIMLPSADSVKHIYQELGSGLNKILYLWRKDWMLEPSMGAHLYIFTPMVKEKFLYSGNKMLSFRNNRTFLRLFSIDKQLLIKRYMRQQHLNINKAPDSQVVALLDFINSINQR